MFVLIYLSIFCRARRVPGVVDSFHPHKQPRVEARCHLPLSTRKLRHREVPQDGLPEAGEGTSSVILTPASLPCGSCRKQVTSLSRSQGGARLLLRGLLTIP